ncbi:MAG: NYN domain-containing protein [Phycisphaerales bacterium]
MPLLIDCYNVLHAEKPSALAGLSEASLCALLAQTRWAAGGVTVVCDGSPKPHSLKPGDPALGAVELIFSGASRSADDVIIELIDADSAPRRLTVVSSDRAVRRAARRRKARDLTAEGFLNRLATAGKTGGGTTAPGKPGTATMGNDQVERWLDWFGIDPADSPDGPPRPRKRDDTTDDFDADLEAFEREFGD